MEEAKLPAGDTGAGLSGLWGFGYTTARGFQSVPYGLFMGVPCDSLGLYRHKGQ